MTTRPGEEPYAVAPASPLSSEETALCRRIIRRIDERIFQSPRITVHRIALILCTRRETVSRMIGARETTATFGPIVSAPLWRLLELADELGMSLQELLA